MSAPARLPDLARERLLSLMRERARLLAPQADLIERAVRRAQPPTDSVAPGTLTDRPATTSASGRSLALTPVLTPQALSAMSASARAPAITASAVQSPVLASGLAPVPSAAPAEATPDSITVTSSPGLTAPDAAGTTAVAHPSRVAPAIEAITPESQTPLPGSLEGVTAADGAPAAAPVHAEAAPSDDAVAPPAAHAIEVGHPGDPVLEQHEENASAQTVLSQHGNSVQAPMVVGTGRFVALKPGLIIAGYRIEAVLGHGGMGQVYRATQLSMNRGVAFKVLSPKLAGNPRFRERFLREARAAGRLHHPNLIAVHDVGEADGMMYFSMELVKGATLASVLKQHGKSPESRALEIVRQVLEALKIAHAAGIVHRDIKPDNLMITAQGMVKVADLGLSLSDENEEDAYTTQAGTLMGTPNYMAPEQGRDAHKVDLRADLYGVGATLYHLVCGTVPFPGETPMEVVVKASSQPLKFPEPGPAPGMRTLIASLMAKKPEDRPQSADQALEMIAKLRRTRVETNPEQHPDAANAIARARARRWRRSLRRSLWGVFTVLGVLVLAAFATLMLSRSQWSQRQHDIEGLTAEHKYREAITTLDTFQPGIFGAHRTDIDRVRADVEKAWDAWAFPLATPVFDDFHKQLAKKQIAAAYEALSKNLKDEWRSPAVRHDQEECEKQFEDAMSSAERMEATRPHELPKEILSRIAEIWGGFTITPPTSVEVKDGLARFSGTGTAVGNAVFAPMGGGAGRQHRPTMVLNARLVGPGLEESDTWALVLSATRTLTINRQGLILRETGKPDRQLVPASAGWVSFRLRRTVNDLELRGGSGEGGEWIALGAASPGQMNVKWHLSDTHTAEVRMHPQIGRVTE
jgi:serine/threonine-protein kinase